MFPFSFTQFHPISPNFTQFHPISPDLESLLWQRFYETPLDQYGSGSSGYTTYVSTGYFTDDGAKSFDHLFFGISAAEALQVIFQYDQ